MQKKTRCNCNYSLLESELLKFCELKQFDTRFQIKNHHKGKDIFK